MIIKRYDKDLELYLDFIKVLKIETENKEKAFLSEYSEFRPIDNIDIKVIINKIKEFKQDLEIKRKALAKRLNIITIDIFL